MHTDYKYPTRLGGAEPPWTFAIGFARRDPAAPPVQGTTSHPTRFLARPSRLRDGPAPRPRRDRLHELGAGDRDLSGGSQGGNLQKSQNIRDGTGWRDAIPALWTKVASYGLPVRRMRDL